MLRVRPAACPPLRAGVVALARGEQRPRWLADVVRLPRAEIDGDRLVVRNVRNFAYLPGSEEIAEERWETRTWHLSKLEGADPTRRTGARR